MKPLKTKKEADVKKPYHLMSPQEKQMDRIEQNRAIDSRVADIQAKLKLRRDVKTNNEIVDLMNKLSSALKTFDMCGGLPRRFTKAFVKIKD